MWGDEDYEVNAKVVIILQYINVSNKHILHPKFYTWYVSYISVSWKKAHFITVLMKKLKDRLNMCRHMEDI